MKKYIVESGGGAMYCEPADGLHGAIQLCNDDGEAGDCVWLADVPAKIIRQLGGILDSGAFGVDDGLHETSVAIMEKLRPFLIEKVHEV